MCNRGQHGCGWGVHLEPYWHTVLSCLTPHAQAGLWVNHFTWTTQAANHAHCVATWDKYAPGVTFEIEVEVKTILEVGALCTVAIYIRDNVRHLPMILHHIKQDLSHSCVLDRSLDVILQEK